MWLKKLLNTESFLFSETCIIEPGSSNTFDRCDEREGAYTVYIDLDNLSNLDNISIQIYIRPRPDSKPILYLTASPKHTDESLWYIDIPMCAGFRIKYTLGSGKNTKLITSAWSK